MRPVHERAAVDHRHHDRAALVVEGDRRPARQRAVRDAERRLERHAARGRRVRRRRAVPRRDAGPVDGHVELRRARIVVRGRRPLPCRRRRAAAAGRRGRGARRRRICRRRRPPRVAIGDPAGQRVAALDRHRARRRAAPCRRCARGRAAARVERTATSRPLPLARTSGLPSVTVGGEPSGRISTPARRRPRCRAPERRRRAPSASRATSVTVTTTVAGHVRVPGLRGELTGSRRLESAATAAIDRFAPASRVARIGSPAGRRRADDRSARRAAVYGTPHVAP